MRRALRAASIACFLLAPSIARAVELRDPVGGARVPLDVDGAKACVVDPEALRDRSACDGLDIASLLDKGPMTAKLPRATNLLYALVRYAGQPLLVGLQRHSAELTTDDFMKELVRGTRAVAPSTVVDETITWAKVGGAVSKRAILRLDEGLVIILNVFQGYGCYYVLELTFPKHLESAALAYESALVGHAGIEPRAAPPPETSGALAIGAGVIGAAMVVVIGLVVRRRRRTIRE